MQIWALILTVYFVGAFVLRKDFAEIFLQTDGAWWLGLLAVALISMAFARYVRSFLSFMSEERHGIFYATAALFCIGGAEYLNSQYDNNVKTETAAVALVPAEAAIMRSWDGHFRTIAQVNGADVGLLIDTGASLVLLRHDDAKRIGLDLNGLEYTTPLTTANGRSYVAPVMIGSLKVGDVMVYNIRAAVAEEGALHSSLLGMSFLEHLEETVIQKDRLVMRN